MKNIFKYLILITLSTTYINASFAEEDSDLPNWNEDAFTGDWGGLREELFKKGIDIEIIHMSDVMPNVSGGVPGDPDHARGTHLKLVGGDGSLPIIELGYYPTNTPELNTNTGLPKLGVGFADINPADWTSSTGVVYQGLIPNRDVDVFGVAINVKPPSEKHNILNSTASLENDFEVTYRAKLKPYLYIQPTIQYITNPGMDKSIDDVTLIGVRTETSI